MPPSPWYAVAEAESIDSPALLFYPDRIEENLRRIARYAGSADRVRLHVKTHKTTEVVALQHAAGFTKFKCATPAEAEMVARADGRDILLAMPPVGPKLARIAALVREFPEVRFSTLADDEALFEALSALRLERPVEVLLDLDTGMNRSGITPGPQAVALYAKLAKLPGLAPGGLHVYDGHIRDRDFAERCAHVEREFAPVDALRDELLRAGLPVPRILAGGTPTFPVHARRADVELSPGTCALWDASYEDKLPELDFLHAALLLTRVISKPGPNRLCLDLGYKAVASDNPDPRARLLDAPDARMIVHSEEHLTIETSQAANFRVGDVLYAVPWHVCPSVALHREAIVVRDGHAAERWEITARDRVLTI